MSFYGITADYNGPLQPANAHTDDDRYDMVELGAAAQSRLFVFHALIYKSIYVYVLYYLF